ncbi:hypothetical protein KIH74_28385 [Kineosporia sp. J2-2]|uniref:4-carboxymuconolactone decarboxylase n=1 Tax=Kineosporia corallincola TaxID=2835133 RepID=A0ABS5TP64_9ACTN|nr:hypothetical protein [Kineosporia corallincola]MBT0772894.1 hypothetical protein [Kineosporia corallincola]
MRKLDVTELDDRGSALRDRILGPGTVPPPPFWIWSQNMDCAEVVEPLGDYCRNRTHLPPGLWELTVLVVARHHRSPFAWYAHYEDAVAGGVPRECLDRLATGQDPAFTDPAVELAHRVMTTLLVRHHLPEPLFAEAVSAFGQSGLIDLLGCMGSFSMSAWALNAFRVGLDDGDDARAWPFPDTEPF